MGNGVSDKFTASFFKVDMNPEDGSTVGYARTNVIGSRTSFVIASVLSSIH